MNESAADFRATLAANRDAQPLVTRCGHCDWTHEGTAGDGRTEAHKHRLEQHPELANVRPRRTRRNLGNPHEKLTNTEYAQARQARTERETADMLAKVMRGRLRDEEAA